VDKERTETPVSDPWEIYDELIETIPADVTVSASSAGLRWCQVLSSEGGLGISYTIAEQSRPPQHQAKTFVGSSLRDVASLAKSWNLAEAGLGMAAVNAWHSQTDRAQNNGFSKCRVNSWDQAFAPFAEVVTGKVVSVIGHFPFVPNVLGRAGELHVIERHTQPGDYPDPACEYLLPGSDFVFISSSAFVNKTMPRLLELSRDARTIVLGPSTPLSTALLDRGVDVITGLVSPDPTPLFDSLSGLTLNGMFDHGYRVEHYSESITASFPELKHFQN
jgi:uncharacterized protein (DUF4213/DUF364 family)